MKVNLGVELDDDQRRALASFIAHKPVKRLASRDDVRDTMMGFICGVTVGQMACVEEPGADVYNSLVPKARDAAAHRRAYSPVEQLEANRLAGEGKSAEYIRGWISAGRVLALRSTPTWENA